MICACARHFLRHKVLVGQRGRLTLIAQRDHRANLIYFGNLKRLPRRVRIKPAHLVGSNPQRRSLQRQVRRSRSQVIESNPVRRVVVAESRLGRTRISTGAVVAHAWLNEIRDSKIFL